MIGANKMPADKYVGSTIEVISHFFSQQRVLHRIQRFKTLKAFILTRTNVSINVRRISEARQNTSNPKKRCKCKERYQRTE